MKEEDGVLNDNDRVNRLNLQEQFCSLILKDEIKWKQWSRNKWLKEGDRNTRFFHSMASARRRVNRITSIASRGRVWESKNDIEKEIVQFLKLLYTGDKRLRARLEGITLRCLSTDSVSSLESPLSRDEIKEAVFNLGGD